MRRIAFAATLLAVACASASGPIPPSPGQADGSFVVRTSGYDDMSPTLGIGSGVWVELEWPAHVAVFEVIHDRGAVLVWPFSESSPRTMPAGRTEIPPQTSDEQRIARWRESWLFPEVGDDPRAPGRMPSSFMLVVASADPLKIDAYLADPQALRRDLRGAFIDQTRAVERILASVVPSPDWYEWGWACTGTPTWCR